MGVATPQRNAFVWPESKKNIVFLKVTFTKHQFLHVVEMLGLAGWARRDVEGPVSLGGSRATASCGARPGTQPYKFFCFFI